MSRERKATYFDLFPELPEFLAKEEYSDFLLRRSHFGAVLARTIQIFYSYSPNDASQQMRLEQHLSGLWHRRVISSWHNRAILLGVDWKQQIDEHLNTADIILLLISPNFMSSQYCYGMMQRALERHKAKEACAIAIILRPVSWEGTPIEQLPVFPSGGKPITTWRPQDSGFQDVAQQIS